MIVDGPEYDPGDEEALYIPWEEIVTEENQEEFLAALDQGYAELNQLLAEADAVSEDPVCCGDDGGDNEGDQFAAGNIAEDLAIRERMQGFLAIQELRTDRLRQDFLTQRHATLQLYEQLATPAEINNAYTHLRYVQGLHLQARSHYEKLIELGGIELLGRAEAERALSDAELHRNALKNEVDAAKQRWEELRTQGASSFEQLNAEQDYAFKLGKYRESRQAVTDLRFLLGSCQEDPQ